MKWQRFPLFKIFLVSVLLVTGLWAANIKEARALYEQKQYEAAYDAFKRLFREDMASVEINLYLGRSALATRRHNEAIAAFERVTLLQPGHAVGRFELGRAYYEAGLYDQAEVAFERVLALPVPDSVRQSVLQHIAQITQSRQKHRVDLMLAIGVLDDSNIRYDSGEITDLGPNAAVSGRAHFEQLSFTYLFNRPAKDRFWQTRVNLFNQNYFDITRESTLATTQLLGGSDFDITYPSIESGWLYKGADMSLYLPLGYSMLQYGGESLFRDWSVGAQLQKPLSGDRALMFEGRLVERAYLAPANESEDALVLDLKGALHTASGGGVGIYRAGLRQEQTHESSVSDTTTLLLGTRQVIAMRAGWGSSFSGDLRYRSDSEKSPIGGKKRQDAVLDLGAMVRMPLDKHRFMALSATYSRGFSNIDDFDYTKRVFSLSYNHLLGDRAFRRIKD
jgi:tetratricopeptide (TPR) repeat protein